MGQIARYAPCALQVTLARVQIYKRYLTVIVLDQHPRVATITALMV